MSLQVFCARCMELYSPNLGYYFIYIYIILINFLKRLKQSGFNKILNGENF